MHLNILNIAFYKFVELNDLVPLRQEMKERAVAEDLKGTILLSPEGINCFLAGSENGIRSFLNYLHSFDAFKELDIKESWSLEVPFTRMLVKLKKEIITMGRPDVQPARLTGARLQPKELQAWLDQNKEVVLVDTRNDYETRLGTFKGALDLNLKTFREFPEVLEKLSPEIKDKPVVMFCTGGIRCEKATALAVKMGFKDVYQLEGGILRYFEDVGGSHYDGECFVFDYRVSVDPALKESLALLCYKCRTPLSLEDQASELYKYEVSCPYCAHSSSGRVVVAGESAQEQFPSP